MQVHGLYDVCHDMTTDDDSYQFHICMYIILGLGDILIYCQYTEL